MIPLKSDTNNDIKDLVLKCVIICLFIFILFLKDNNNMIKSQKRWILFFSILVTFLNVLGHLLFLKGSLEYLFGNWKLLCYFSIKVIWYSFLVYAFISKYYLLIHDFIIGFTFKPLHKKRLFILLIILMLLCWLPYFLLCWPGTLSVDANSSIAQSFNDPTFSSRINTIKLINPNVIINNHHPVFYTLYLGVFSHLGRYLDNMELALSFYTIIQMLIMSCIFSYGFNYMVKQKVPDFIVLCGILFVCLCPTVPFYMVTIIKDVFYIGFMILSVIYLHRLLNEDFEFRQTIEFIFILLGLTLSRNNGFYIVVISFLLMLIFLIKKRKIISKIFLPVICIYLSITNIIYPYFEITPGSPREMYSVIFQQLTRTISIKGDNWLDEEEKNIIKYVLRLDDINELKELYNPERADAIKSKYNPEVTQEDFSKFLKVWMHGLRQFPIIYVDSFLINTYPYYSMYCGAEENIIYYINRDYGRYNDYNIKQNKFFKSLREKYGYNYRNFMTNNNLLSYLSNMGFSAYLIYFGLIQIIMYKKYKYLFIYIFEALNYLICFLGPVAYYRYGTPYTFAVPFLLGITAIECWKGDNNGKINTTNF